MNPVLVPYVTHLQNQCGYELAFSQSEAQDLAVLFNEGDDDPLHRVTLTVSKFGITLSILDVYTETKSSPFEVINLHNQRLMVLKAAFMSKENYSYDADARLMCTNLPFVYKEAEFARLYQQVVVDYQTATEIYFMLGATGK